MERNQLSLSEEQIGRYESSKASYIKDIAVTLYVSSLVPLESLTAWATPDPIGQSELK